MNCRLDPGVAPGAARPSGITKVYVQRNPNALGETEQCISFPSKSPEKQMQASGNAPSSMPREK
jgi:hypothetical protein